jgi:hypothetical protein
MATKTTSAGAAISGREQADRPALAALLRYRSGEKPDPCIGWLR